MNLYKGNIAMREFKFKIPSTDNQGQSLSELHDHIQETLCKSLGGLTRTIEHGQWIGADGTLYSEEVQTYTVAIEPQYNNTLVNWAVKWAKLAEQEAVYIQDVSGNVTIMPLSNLEILGAKQLEKSA